jgi:NADPH:quinone reductase-like Zn-dependent oxidoreductase
MLPILGTGFGAYASRCCIDEKMLSPAPDNVKLCDLAALPLVACTVITAMRAVVNAFDGDVKGKKCFISCGSGGVGTFAIQYFYLGVGSYVATNCIGTNFQFVRELGASHVFDYKTKQLEDEIKDFDVVIDSMGYAYEERVFRKNANILRRSGKYISHYVRIASSPYEKNSSHWMSSDPLGLSIPESRIDRVIWGILNSYICDYLYSIRYHFVLVVPDQAALQECATLMQNGKIRAVIEKRFPLAEASRAHELLEEGHVTGKLVLAVNSRVLGNEDSSIHSQYQPSAPLASH